MLALIYVFLAVLATSALHVPGVSLKIATALKVLRVACVVIAAGFLLWEVALATAQAQTVIRTDEGTRV